MHQRAGQRFAELCEVIRSGGENSGAAQPVAIEQFALLQEGVKGKGATKGIAENSGWLAGGVVAQADHRIQLFFQEAQEIVRAADFRFRRSRQSFCHRSGY
ncbi:hypothetical protein D3C83_37090 [compost metagenome]